MWRAVVGCVRWYVRGMSGAVVGCVRWWWCMLSVYVPLCEKWTFKHGGGCGIFRGSAIFVYVKSLHLPHTIPESTSTASAASSLPALLNSPYWFLDNDRRSFSKVKYMHKHAMPQNTIMTVLDTVFLYIVYLHIKSLTFMPLALILYSS